MEVFMTINFKCAYLLNVPNSIEYARKMHNPEKGTFATSGTFVSNSKIENNKVRNVGNVLVLNAQDAYDYQKFMTDNFGIIKMQPLTDKLNKEYAAKALYIDVPLEDMREY